ncbi:multifunctional oxoglutarate decarboxylase/oxoglutarate dehydrogenase thiamine pyrophosphate-binding subunit/dihydrolipoyllysine-residue succinyltransferase subunit [Scrofimicrobium sp. R131]|uniref:Multifunctional oxoglutarate decarboxylase/oxoglutarate dehydrogenase thiamine pyrophosphate-binding subunit/dihydrolipoyllysine-residue succinyltransferase subunit n=1 Tax=Scrofimicrobium appendicitidis TaxID=3079930 RepID=A0AAU7V8R5_9ACTO
MTTNIESEHSDWGPNEWYVAQMYEAFIASPDSVSPAWREFFTRKPEEGVNAVAHQGTEALLSESTVSAEEAFAGEETNVVSVARSDLPPAPPTAVSEATSPYTRTHGQSSPAARRGQAAPEQAVARLKGSARAVVKNMEASLAVPTATSARQIPAKLLIENRAVINAHLERTVGGKVSFTHLIGYALVEALVEMPSMNVRYLEQDGKPSIENFAHVGLGLAIDVPRADGSRSLLVPVVKEADTLTFLQFRDACNDLIVRARDGQLSAADFQGASVSLTNPGTIGTTHSVPRLMPGQGVIIGVGATDYPAEWAGLPLERLAQIGVGKIMYVTSTYDHRVIQGAGSGEFLRLVHRKLTGEDGFYDRVFSSLKVPYPPYRWERDVVYDAERDKGKPARIVELIHAYRSRGHLAADTDPLAYRVRHHPDLELSRYGLNVWDLDRVFPTGGFGGTNQMMLRDLLRQLRDTYTRSVGIEYMHIQDPAQRLWVQKEVEQPYQKPSREEQHQILETLIHAEAFEEFLQTKFVGQKRFSLEGGESLIPLLDAVLNSAARSGLNEVAIGMAHRGRLNVLSNIAGKSFAQIFSEFEGQKHKDQYGSGDVKYHLGTEGVYSADDGVATNVYLAANPSHLEAANGVLEGVVRGKQDELGDPSFPVLPLLIHGDAAFIGQGVVSEIFNMSQVDGFRTGGTLHVIVNNQIGFTTGPTAGRSTRYPTDLAKGMQLPIFHVNADDPETVVRMARLAFKYREEFHKDVLIDLVCYRRRGHNEGDDPSMTQPVMYKLIDSIPSTREVYTRNLVGRGDITLEEATEYHRQYENQLSSILEETREHGWEPEANERHGLEVPTAQLPGHGMMIGWSSAAPAEQLERVGEVQVAFPAGFEPHKKIRQLGEKRLAMARGEVPVDWGFAELMALGTLLMDGTPVRLTGQDARRATFVQRQATLHDQNDGREFTPLNFLVEDQAPFYIYDSTLSEYAPLAFEYGYSIERPDTLVLWEAQFGDFANGAQTVIDEFISSAEQKWGQQSSLVMLLPHGYEGQGPDHSSARIERYLQLAAEDNLRICQPSTPANHFHLLRRQAYLRPRKPLIEFTPKQLLRLSAATSSLSEFTSGEFQPVLGDREFDGPNVRKVLLCSGRIYYDLAKERAKQGRTDIAIVRLEQLYPLPLVELTAALTNLGHADLVWVQDEPQNQGPWPFLALNLFPELKRKVSVVSRAAASAPATGLGWKHRQEIEEILAEAFA